MMPTSLFPPAVLHFRVDTTASVGALEAVLAEIASDAPRAAEIRHVKIAPGVRVWLSRGDLVLESAGRPDGVEVRAVVVPEPSERGTTLVGTIFRPGTHGMLAALAGFALFLVWQALDDMAVLLLLLPLLAWMAILATRIGGYNRRRADLLIQTMTHIARLAEAMPPATVDAAHRRESALLDRDRSQSWFARVGGGTIIGGAVFWGYLALRSFRFLPPQNVTEGFSRVGGSILFGGLMGRAWFASRDWSFLGRWTPVVRGVVAGGTSAWLVADLGMPIGTLRSWQILAVGIVAGVLLGLWSESSEAPAG